MALETTITLDTLPFFQLLHWGKIHDCFGNEPPNHAATNQTKLPQSDTRGNKQLHLKRPTTDIFMASQLKRTAHKRLVRTNGQPRHLPNL